VLLCAPLVSALAAPMPFEVFSRLYVGMPESELHLLANPPDYAVDDAAATDLLPAREIQDARAPVRRMGWKSGSDSPYTTEVSVSGGRVVAIDREPDF
jgi:hypothetical protein